LDLDEIVQGEMSPDSGGKRVAPMKTADEGAKDVLPGGTIALRVYWGRFPAGQWILPFTVGSPVETSTAVFVSIGESISPGSVTAGTLVGGATLTVDNVGTPRRGQIDVGITVDWGSPIAVQLNYLIVPAP